MIIRTLGFAVLLSGFPSANAGAQVAHRGRLQDVNSNGCLGGGDKPLIENCETAPILEFVPLSPDRTLIRDGHRERCLVSGRDGRFEWSSCAPPADDAQWSVLGNLETQGGALLRSAATNQCLFSNRDGRFGRFTCTQGYDDQSWRLLGPKPRPVLQYEQPVGLQGDWIRSDGRTTVMHSNGTIDTPNDRTGTWHCAQPTECEVRFGDGPTLAMRLSPDGNELHGSTLSARRKGSVAPPATKCLPMPACGLACPYGMAHDANGCGLCACVPDPSPSKIQRNPIKN